MFTVSMGDSERGFSMIYSKAPSLEDAVKKSIKQIFPSNRLMSMVDNLPLGTNNPEDVEAVTSSFSNDFSIDNVDENNVNNYFINIQSLTDVIAVEVDTLGTEEFNDSTPFFHKPTKVIPVVTSATITGKNAMILVKPKCVQILNKAANVMLDSEERKLGDEFKSVMDILYLTSAVYSFLANTNFFAPFFDNLATFNTPKLMQQMAHIRYGKKYDIKGITPFIRRYSMYPLGFLVDKSADQNSIRVLFYFLGLWRKYMDTKQMAVKEFGIKPQKW